MVAFMESSSSCCKVYSVNKLEKLLAVFLKIVHGEEKCFTGISIIIYRAKFIQKT